MESEQTKAENAVKAVKNNIVQRIITMQNDLLLEIQKEKKYINFDTNLPNTGITLNNKIVELQHEFEHKDMSLYTSHFKHEGTYYDGMLSISHVGEAIINDLVDISLDGTKDLSNFITESSKALSDKVQDLVALNNQSPIKKFFNKIKSFFGYRKNNTYEFKKIDNDNLKEIIKQYKNTNEKVYNYNLKDNLASSIVKQIKDKQYDPELVPEILEEAFFPDIEKLGLSDIIPTIKEKIIEEYKKDLSGLDAYKINNVPNFNKNENNLEYDDTSKNNLPNHEDDLSL